MVLAIVVLDMTICEGSQKHQSQLDSFLADLEQLFDLRPKINMECTIVAIGYVNYVSVKSPKFENDHISLTFVYL